MQINGTPFDDSLIGTTVSDTIFGFEGDDTILGLAGDDFVFAGTGLDEVDGGDGYDVIFFEDEPTGVTIDLETGSAITSDGVESILNFEAAHGSGFGDLIRLTSGDNHAFGRAGDDTIEGLAGNDFIVGGSGADLIDGGAGTDFADFSDDGFDSFGPIFQGVSVDLATGTAIDGWGFNDTLIGIEGASGSRFADTIAGDANHNNLGGVDGDDVIDGRAGNDFISGDGGNDQIFGGDGDDFISGGSGSDTIDGGFGGTDSANYADNGFDSFGAIVQGANVDLSTGIAIDGWGFVDFLTNISGASGTDLADTLFGDANNNNFAGLDGDDILDGRGGNDFITGDTGNDQLFGGDGNDNLNGGDGNDTIDPGINPLFDFIRPGGGDDVVDLSAAGDDFYIISYNNTSSGLAANFSGGVGTVIEANGTDTIVNYEQIGGPNGGLSFDGTFGDDLIQVDLDNDIDFFELEGFGGNDTLIGGTGNFRLDYAGSAAGVNVDLAAGVTTEDGFGGQDVHAGIDELRGSNFTDVLIGSASNERFITRGGDDTVDGAGGFDTLRYDRSGIGSVEVDLQTGTATGTFRGDAFTQTISNIEAARGSSSDDTLLGDGEFNEFRGGGGDDFIDGRDGLDLASFFDANGAVTVDIGAVTIATGAGIGTDTIVNVDLFFGSSFDDTMSANDQFDNGLGFLFGEQRLFNRMDGGLGGDDIFVGNGGTRLQYLNATGPVVADFSTGTVTGDSSVGTDHFDAGIFEILGSKFDDTLLGSSNTPTLAGYESFIGGDGADFIDGGDGIDRVFYAFDDNGVFVDLEAGFAIDGFGNTDTLISIEDVKGGNNDDTLLGTEDDNVFEPQQGIDLIDGRGGRDTVLYDDTFGGVTVDLEQGFAIDNTGSTDQLISIENASGSGFDDVLNGDELGNELSGFFGDDTLEGRGGDDTLTGGEGDDLIIIADGDGNDTITDFTAGSGTDDVIDISDIAGFTNLAAVVDASSDNGQDTTIDLGGGQSLVLEGVLIDNLTDDDFVFAEQEGICGTDGRDLLFGTHDDDLICGKGGNDILLGRAGDDTVQGDDGRDIIFGGFGDDDLQGGNGKDRLFGGFGDDDLTGGEGKDKLFGGRGDDTLDGGAGSDYLTGGSGRDTFVIDGNGHDRINDFHSGKDVIDVSALGFDGFDDLLETAQRCWGRVIFDFDDGGSLTINSAKLHRLGEEDFIF